MTDSNHRFNEVVAEEITNLLSSLDEDRATILGKLTNIENKVDRL
ncbi:hypothetical protein [Chroococcidiopsis sp [FACHB-1243]]|nr:hypothetical protein [Chroococcidiopsis sp. [FACHB-1243]]